MKIHHDKTANRENLLQIFLAHCTPKPQRKMFSESSKSDEQTSRKRGHSSPEKASETKPNGIVEKKRKRIEFP